MTTFQGEPDLAKVTASSNYKDYAHFRAASMFDGDEKTSWVSSDGFPNWVTIDFTKFVLVKQIRLIRRSNASNQYKNMEVLVKLGGKINFKKVLIRILRIIDGTV